MTAERSLHFQPEQPRQHRIVAHLGVRIERQVRRVHGDVVGDQRAKPAVTPPRDRKVAVEEEAMMHQQQRGTAERRYTVDRGLRRIHRRHDPVDFAAVLHLEAVHRAVVVGHLTHAEVSVQVRHHFGEGDRLAHLPPPLAARDARIGRAARPVAACPR